MRPRRSGHGGARRSRWGCAWLLLAAGLVRGGAAEAQQPGAAALPLVGVVSEAGSGAPVATALVTVVPGGAQAIADAQGRFRFAAVAAGPMRLRVQRVGYRTLEVEVTVAEGMPPLEIRLEPDPVQLEGLSVPGGQRAPFGGSVVNARSGEPVAFADVTLTEDGVRPVGRPQTADASGAFRVGDVAPGRYLLRVERLGYVSQYLPVAHGAPPEPVEVRLEPDTVLQRGLAVMTGELALRRQAHPRPTRLYDEGLLRTARSAGMREFLEAYTALRLVRCQEREIRRNCVELRGLPTKPIIHIDGIRVPDVAGPLSYALEQLELYEPRDFFVMESFECPGGATAAGMSGEAALRPLVEIHLYTHAYMERMARRPRVPLPSCIPGAR